MKYLSIDLETTGLDADYSSILELAVIYDDGVSKIEDLKRFHCLFHHTIISGDLFAFAMNAEILKEIAGISAPTTPVLMPSAAYQEFRLWYLNEVLGVLTVPTQLFDKWNSTVAKNPKMGSFNMAGKNPNFDRKFLDEWSTFKKDFSPRHRVVDPTIGFAKWDDDVLPNLELCKARAGFSNQTVTHRAMDDALDIVRLVRSHFNISY